jgi:hypothetical protein
LAELAGLDGGGLKEMSFRAGHPSDPLFHIDPEGGGATLNLERIWWQTVKALDAAPDPGPGVWINAWHTLLGACAACLLNLRAATMPESGLPAGISGGDLKAHFMKRMQGLCRKFDVEPPAPTQEPFFGKKLAEFHAAESAAGDRVGGAQKVIPASYRDQILAAADPEAELDPSTTHLVQPSIRNHAMEQPEAGV